MTTLEQTPSLPSSAEAQLQADIDSQTQAAAGGEVQHSVQSSSANQSLIGETGGLVFLFGVALVFILPLLIAALFHG